MFKSEIPLTEAVGKLREELLGAMEAAEGKGLRFEVRDVEVELQVAVTKEAATEAGGGVNLWVLGKTEGKVSGKVDSSRVQKVTLKLRPKTEEDGEPGGDGKAGKGADSGMVMLKG